MRYSKFLCMAVLASCVIAFSARPAPASPGGESEAALAADAGLQNLLQLVPDAELPLLGFSDRQETYRAGTGEPFMVYTLSPAAVIGFSAGGAVGGLLEGTGEWYVPVLVDGEYRALVTVVPSGGKLAAVGISAAGLARELEDFRRWQESQGIETAAPPRFVRIRQAVSDFMYLETGEGEYLRPFSSARAALGVSGDTLLEPAGVMPGLKTAVQNNMK